MAKITFDKPLARKCIRCGHFECPCCNDFCDSCFEPEKEQISSENDDFWFVKYDYSNDMFMINKKCAGELGCKYETEVNLDEWKTLWERVDSEFGVGGSFGVLDDGRIWFSDSDEE